MTTVTPFGFRTEPGTRYEMPIVFGPSRIPTVSRWGYARAVDVSFVTIHDAIRPFVPIELDLPDEPLVTVSRRTFDQVDYLAGHGYEELCIGVGVSHQSTGDAERGLYWLAMWVDQVHPIIAGREITGYPKLGAEFPPLEERNGSFTYDVRELGSLLVHASVVDAEPVAPDVLAAVNGAAARTISYCSRYIPPIGGGDGLDQLTRSESGFAVTSYRRGSGSVTFGTPSWDDAPQSATAVGALAALPVVRVRSGSVIEGNSWFDRSTVTALPRLGATHHEP